MQTCIFIRETHLGDPVVPAHPPEACGSQDDGGEVLLLVQLLQTCVEIPTLGMSVQENTSEEQSPTQVSPTGRNGLRIRCL